MRINTTVDEADDSQACKQGIPWLYIDSPALLWICKGAFLSLSVTENLMMSAPHQGLEIKRKRLFGTDTGKKRLGQIFHQVLPRVKAISRQVYLQLQLCFVYRLTPPKKQKRKGKLLETRIRMHE